MNRQVGLWIDHKKAVIVFLADGREEVREIRSGTEQHVRFSGGQEADSAEDIQDNKFAGHLSKYYDEVITDIGDAESILILGPGEAKGELRKRLASKEHAGHTVDVETVDKLTNGQIAARVREHFQK
jgi:hypothetical protein